MKNLPVYKTIEITGTSIKSVEDAVNSAIERAHQTIKHLSWFQVIETRGNIEKGSVRHWQVTIKIGFALEKIDTYLRGLLNLASN
jgi:flavin-binding protein dodecin